LSIRPSTSHGRVAARCHFTCKQQIMNLDEAEKTGQGIAILPDALEMARKRKGKRSSSCL